MTTIFPKGGGNLIRHYSGTYFQLNDMTGMFCCSDITGKKDRSIRLQKRSNLMEIWKKGDMVKLANVSEETRRFIGISRRETEIAQQQEQDAEELFINCPMSWNDINRVIEEGSIEYTIGNDRGRKIRRTARMIASSADDDVNNPYYAILYNIIPARKKNDGAVTVRIRTFGYFEIFVNGSPVHFKSAKAKELLAILVDRRGGYVSASEAISCLWEDETSNRKTLARYRKVAMRLRNELNDNDIPDLVITTEGKRCINQAMVQCDLYDYLTDKEKNKELFHGAYMLNYSWGEFTQAELLEL